MEQRHRVSSTGIELIKRFEGLRRNAARLSDGGWTIGYGHTRSARAGATVDEADAEALLRYDLQEIEAAVNADVYTPLTQNQYDALVAFAFSVGPETLRRSNVLRRVNEGDLLAAAAALETWRRADFEGEVIVVDALIRRRSAEKALFLTPTDGFIAVPSTALRPQMDFGAPALQRPVAAAADIVTPLDGDAVAPERAPVDAPAPFNDGPSPAQLAAERVSRRLQALFADDPLTPPPPPPSANDPASPFAEPELEPQGLVEVYTQPETGPLTRPPEPDPAPEDSFDRRIAQGPVLDLPPAAKDVEESSSPYWILCFIGLALFGLGVWLILQGQSAGETGLFEQRSATGGLFGVIGIACVCTAVYQILKSIGRNGDGEGG